MRIAGIKHNEESEDNNMQIVGPEEVEHSLISFGNNFYGQLGSKSTEKGPHEIRLPLTEKHENGAYLCAAGKGFSIIAEVESVKREQHTHAASYQAISEICRNIQQGKGVTILTAYIEKTFSWPSSLNASFLEEDHLWSTGSMGSGVALESVRKTFDLLLRIVISSSPFLLSSSGLRLTHRISLRKMLSSCKYLTDR